VDINWQYTGNISWKYN